MVFTFIFQFTKFSMLTKHFMKTNIFIKTVIFGPKSVYSFSYSRDLYWDYIAHHVSLSTKGIAVSLPSKSSHSTVNQQTRAQPGIKAA